MFSSIRTSEENKSKVSELTSKLQLGTENVIARLALSYSISQSGQMNLQDIKDSKGKSYSKQVLFGDHLSFYVALICQHYHIYKTNQEIPRYLKLHIDDGIELLYDEVTSNPNLLGTDFLLNCIEEGLLEMN